MTTDLSVLETSKELLLGFSDDSLDAAAKALIAKWSSPVTAMQVLEVLDQCIYSSLATDLIVLYLQSLYDVALLRECKTHEEIVVSATWREEH